MSDQVERSAFEVVVGRDGWLAIRATPEALADLAAHISPWDQDLSAAITAGLTSEPYRPTGGGSASARSGRARRVAFAALQRLYREEFETLYAEMMERDQGPSRPARHTVAVTPYKASCNPGEVERNNKRNRCRGRAWTVLARAHEAEFRVLYKDALARDEGPVAPYARRRRTLA